MWLVANQLEMVLAEYPRNIRNNLKLLSARNVIHRGGWTSPAMGVYKLNADSGLNPDSVCQKKKKNPDSGKGRLAQFFMDSGGNLTHSSMM
jgi:uncharacterized protein (DUF1800 family)